MAQMAGAPAALSRTPIGYAEWLADVKARIHAAQQRAAFAVNREMLALYWQLGRDILERQAAGAWGDGILDQVSADLRAAFPAMKGFSRSNLMYMRAFAEAWPEADFVQQPVGQLPWGHNLVLLTKLKERDARLAYASRAVLMHHLVGQGGRFLAPAVLTFPEHLRFGVLMAAARVLASRDVWRRSAAVELGNALRLSGEDRTATFVATPSMAPRARQRLGGAARHAGLEEHYLGPVVGDGGEEQALE